MVLTATLTTGCTDENEDVAYNLWGTWEGNMYMQSQYNGRVYQSSYSVLAFDKNPYQYASGTATGLTTTAMPHGTTIQAAYSGE